MLQGGHKEHIAAALPSAPVDAPVIVVSKPAEEAPVPPVGSPHSAVPAVEAKDAASTPSVKARD